MPRDPRARLGGRGKAALAACAVGLALVGALLLRRSAVPAPPAASATVTAAPESPAPPASPPASPPAPGTAARVVTSLPVSTMGSGDRPLPPEAARIIESGSQEPLVPREMYVDVQISPRGTATAEPLVPPVLELPGPESGAPIAPPRGREVTGEPLVPRDIRVPAE